MAGYDASTLIDRALPLLAAWAESSERWWYDLPGGSDLGCYGTGYAWWGVQTNQKYAAAMAVLAARGEGHVDREWALRRALASLRFSLASHVSGPPEVTCTDGRKWGHNWITALGIERMMHGVALIGDHLTPDDRAALRRVITSEAGWLFADHRRGRHHGVFGDRWDSSGKNAPESNLWNGALLWRAATMYPDARGAEGWRERAHEFLVNGVSVPGDANDAAVVAGKAIRDRFRGANFFPNLGLDHHGYLNVGYMAICTSNAAILHFDLKRAGLAAPQTLHHHQADLWATMRRMVFPDGRLIRIGGDSRVRYAYCQEYLLPTLLYAADHLGEAHALPLAAAQLGLMGEEAEYSGDGSFYGRRLAHLATESPYYYTRVEADRANALSMCVAYAPLVGDPPAVFADDFEASVEGAWVEPEHGAALHREKTRFASFSWRAYAGPQGLCLPPSRSDLAEWKHNLAGVVRFVGQPEFPDWGKRHRKVLSHHVDLVDGGFVTCGTVSEGCDVAMAEGWHGGDLAKHQIAFAALPDGHTVVGLQLCRAAASVRTYTTEIKGLHLGVPNDLYNGFARELTTAEKTHRLAGSPEADALLRLDSRWAHVDDALGVIGIYGADELVLHRSATRRGGKLHSLFVEELCWRCELGVRAQPPGATLLDVGWAVVSGVGADETRHIAEHAETRSLLFTQPDVRGVSIIGVNGHRHAVVANFGEAEARVKLPSGRTVTLGAGRATIV